MPQLTLKECAYLLNATTNIDRALNGFCVDTRLINAGDLFFALPGSKVDGHQYLEEASARGAAACVVSDAYQGPLYGLFCIRVPDVLFALQDLARQVQSQSKAQIIAITGSVGKTTTKEFTAALLKSKFNVAQTPGNSNSQIGLPLAILNHTTGQEEVLILEMGLTLKGQIARLVEIAPPDVAVLTTTGLVHAENFDSVDAIGRAKAEIFGHPKTRLGVIDRNISNYDELCKSGDCYKISFSITNSAADYFLEDSGGCMRISGQRFSPIVLGGLNVPAKHNRHNFLAAAIVGRSLGMTWADIESAMAFLALPERRMELVEKSGILFINDSYNASELSVKAALESMPQPKKGGKKVAIIGEMLELGKFSDACHKAVGEYALNHVDAVVCYGEHCHPIIDVWKAAGKPAFLSTDTKVLFKQVKSLIVDGDVVLLKGSRSKGMWKILEEF